MKFLNPRCPALVPALVLAMTVLLAVPQAMIPGAARAADPPPEARQALFQAQALLDEQRPAEAARIMDQYLATTGKPPAEAWLLLGLARYEAGKGANDKSGALEAFRAGLKHFPDDPLLCRNLAVLLFEAGQYAEAAPLFEKAHGLQEKPEPELLYQAGSAWYLAGDYNASARVLDRLAATASPLEMEWIQLAVHAFLAAGNLDRAETMVLALLRDAPGDAARWELLAKIHLDRERFDKAAAALEMAYDLKSPTVRELEQLADLYVYVNAPLRAVSVLERAHGAAPDGEWAVRLAELYADSGRVDQAVGILERASVSTDALLAKGKILFRARDFRAAARALDACLERSPGNAEAHLYRGLCAWENQDWELARREFLRVAGNKECEARASAALDALGDLEQARLDALAP